MDVFEYIHGFLVVVYPFSSNWLGLRVSSGFSQPALTPDPRLRFRAGAESELARLSHVKSWGLGPSILATRPISASSSRGSKYLGISSYGSYDACRGARSNGSEGKLFLSSPLRRTSVHSIPKHVKSGD